MATAKRPNAGKLQISVRLEKVHLGLIDDLQEFYGGTRSEIARHLLIESLEQKNGLELLRQKGAIR